jgi:hypothetical protein
LYAFIPPEAFTVIVPVLSPKHLTLALGKVAVTLDTVIGIVAVTLQEGIEAVTV